MPEVPVSNVGPSGEKPVDLDEWRAKWEADLERRVSKLEQATFPIESTNATELDEEPPSDYMAEAEEGYGACGYKGHPRTSHICQTGGVPLPERAFAEPGKGLNDLQEVSESKAP